MNRFSVFVELMYDQTNYGNSYLIIHELEMFLPVISEEYSFIESLTSTATARTSCDLSPL